MLDHKSDRIRNEKIRGTSKTEAAPRDEHQTIVLTKIKSILQFKQEYESTESLGRISQIKLQLMT